MAITIDKFDNGEKDLASIQEGAVGISAKDDTTKIDEYTDRFGNTRPTLPKILVDGEAKFDASITQKEQEFYLQVQYKPSIPWAANTPVSDKTQLYAGSGDKRYRPKPDKVPFTTGATIADDIAKGLWVAYGEATQEFVSEEVKKGVGKYSIYSAGSVSDMIAGRTNDGAIISHLVGQRWLVDDYYGGASPSNSGILFFSTVANGTGTADGGKFIQGSGFQFKQNLKLPVQVKAYGARGDWNSTLKTGRDDTDNIQKAFNYGINSNWRSAGHPAVHYNGGSYLQTDTINIRNASGFNALIRGDGQDISVIYGKVGPSKDVFDSNIEFYRFKDLCVIGNDSESRVGMARSHLNAYNSGGAADIDMAWDNCRVLYATSGTRATGRNVKYSNGSVAGSVDFLIDIYSPNPWVQRGSDNTDSAYTGMRGYQLHGCKFDVVSRLVRTNEGGPAAEYINDISIDDCNGSACDVMIEANSRILSASIGSGNSFTYSFGSGLIRGKSISNVVIGAANVSKQYDINKNPSVNADTMQGIVTVTDTINNLTIDGLVARSIRDWLVSAQFIDGLTITGMQASQMFTYNTVGRPLVVAGTTGSAKNVRVKDNNFDGTNPGNANYYNPTVQNAEDFITSGNLGTLNIERSVGQKPVKVVIGGTESDLSASSKCFYLVDGENVTANYTISGTIPAGSGTFEIKPPLTPAKNDPSLSFSGSGSVSEYGGVSLTNELIIGVTLNQGQNIRIKIGGPSGTRNMNRGDITGVFNIVLSITYRYRL